MQEPLGALSGSREPSRSVSALSGFDPERGVTIPLELYHFLMGEGPLDGTWFDEMERGLGRRGRYWWRALLLSCGRNAQAIEARRVGTAKQGSIGDESAVA